MYCSHDVIETIAFCPDCGKAMCPQCGSHDVYQVSRVTGYLSDVSGWASGKLQELKDRQHYDVGSSLTPLNKAVVGADFMGERDGN
jgi:anaerobic ribonucleoside-triphosphate reductase